MMMDGQKKGYAPLSESFRFNYDEGWSKKRVMHRCQSPLELIMMMDSQKRVMHHCQSPLDLIMVMDGQKRVMHHFYCRFGLIMLMGV
jgi:hypothetical protein